MEEQSTGNLCRQSCVLCSVIISDTAMDTRQRREDVDDENDIKQGDQSDRPTNPRQCNVGKCDYLEISS